MFVNIFTFACSVANNSCEYDGVANIFSRLCLLFVPLQTKPSLQVSCIRFGKCSGALTVWHCFLWKDEALFSKSLCKHVECHKGKAYCQKQNITKTALGCGCSKLRGKYKMITFSISSTHISSLCSISTVMKRFFFSQREVIYIFICFLM